MRSHVPAAAVHQTTLPAYSRATRLRALGWAVALEAALLAALLAATQPAWVLVYLSQSVFSFLPVFVVRGLELRRRAVLAYLMIVIVAYVGFLLYPTSGRDPLG